jgi:hypothetical protein
MRNFAIGLAVVAFGACVAGPTLAAAADETEHVSKTAPFNPGGTLRLKNFSGRVTITAENRRDVAIDAVRRATRDRLDRIKLDVHNEGDVLVVDANHKEGSWGDWWGRNNNVVETDLDVKVPRKTNLDVNVFSSPVRVQGVEGTHKLHGFSSRLTLDDISGPVQVHTFSGAVEIRTASWQPRQTIDVDTFSGSVDLHVPDNAKAAVSFNSFSGRLDSGTPLTFSSLNTRRHRTLDARLGPDDADAGSLRVKTFSGSCRINR